MNHTQSTLSAKEVGGNHLLIDSNVEAEANTYLEGVSDDVPAPVPSSNFDFDDAAEKRDQDKTKSDKVKPEVITSKDAPVPLEQRYFRSTPKQVTKPSFSGKKRSQRVSPVRFTTVQENGHGAATDIHLTIQNICTSEDQDCTNQQLEKSQHSSSNDTNTAGEGLAIAHPVQAYLHEDEPVYEASELDPSVKASFYRSQRCCTFMALTFLLAGVIIAVSVVYAPRNQQQDGIVSQKPTMKPTSYRESLGIQELIEEKVLERNVTFSDMNMDDPRYLALDWILHNDKLQLTTDDPNLLQRYTLALLAFTFDVYSWECGMVKELDACNITDDFGDYALWLSGTNECLWYGVTCENDVVYELDLCE